jgi:hypothetical protein
MKKIVFLFFTFLGICPAFAQKPAETVLSDSGRKNKQIDDYLPRKPFIKLFPNPAKNKVEIEINGFEPGFIQVQIADQNSNPVKIDKRRVFVGNEIIVLMFSINPGIYFVAVKQDKKLARSKLVIQ